LFTQTAPQARDFKAAHKAHAPVLHEGENVITCVGNLIRTPRGIPQRRRNESGKPY